MVYFIRERISEWPLWYHDLPAQQSRFLRKLVDDGIFAFISWFKRGVQMSVSTGRFFVRARQLLKRISVTFTHALMVRRLQ